MSHLWRSASLPHDVVASKGAPEAVAKLCQMPEAQYNRIATQANRMADSGLRVLGVARARHHSATAWPDSQQGV